MGKKKEPFTSNNGGVQKTKTKHPRFLEKWKREFEWLRGELNVEGADTATCVRCVKPLKAYHHSMVEHHKGFHSKENINDAKKKAEEKKRQAGVAQLLSEQITPSRADLAACELEAAIAGYQAIHARSILSVNEMNQLIRDQFSTDPKVAGLQMQKSKCRFVITGVLAPYICKLLREDVGDQPFSLQVDEVTDITVTKFLGIVIQYASFQKQKIVTRFLGLQPILHGTSEGILDGMNTLLGTLSLDMRKVAGLGMDGCSVMTGEHNGVHRKLVDWQKNAGGEFSAFLVKCTCHSLDLAAQKAVEAHIPASAYSMPDTIWVFFGHSSVRCTVFQEYQATVIRSEGSDRKPTRRFMRPCPTRWMYVYISAQKLLEIRTDIVGFVRRMASRTREDPALAGACELILPQVGNLTNWIYLAMMAFHLEELFLVWKKFESATSDPLALLHSLTELKKKLVKEYTGARFQPQLVWLTPAEIEDHVDDAANFYLGARALLIARELAVDPSNSREILLSIQMQGQAFVLRLIEEVHKRLPRNVELLEKMTLFGVENVMKITKDLDAGDKVLSIVKEIKPGVSERELVAIADQYHRICIDSDALEAATNKKTETFWFKVAALQDDGVKRFKELSNFALLLLTLPHLNADVERIFSVMNHVKSKRRGSLNIGALNALLHLRYASYTEDKPIYRQVLPVEVLQQVGAMGKYDTKRGLRNIGCLDPEKIIFDDSVYEDKPIEDEPIEDEDVPEPSAPSSSFQSAASASTTGVSNQDDDGGLSEIMTLLNASDVTFDPTEIRGMGPSEVFMPDSYVVEYVQK